MFSERPPRRLRNRGPDRTHFHPAPGTAAALAHDPTPYRRSPAPAVEEPKDEPRLVVWMLPVMFAIAGTAAYLYWPFENENTHREWRGPDGRPWGGGGGYFGSRLAQAVEDYFALPAIQRPQYLDQQIESQEARIAELKRQSEETGQTAGAAEAEWAHRRSDRIGMVLATVTPQERQKFDAYLNALSDRRRSRNLPDWYMPDVAAAAEKATLAAMAAAATQPTPQSQ